jgi:multicomponent Na+:H+ antiporter subunit D
MEITSIRPLLAILVSAVSVILIGVSGKRPNLREFWTLIAALCKFCIITSMLPEILSGAIISYKITDFLLGFSLSLKVDSFGLLFALVASFLWILTSLYSIGYMRSLREHAQTRYFACFAIALSATTGVAFSENLITLFLFYEMLTLSTFPLVTHKETEEARAAGRKYVAYILGGSISLCLIAIVLTYNIAGTLSFSETGIFTETPSILILIYFLFLFGFTKAAIMPLHSWLPAAMVAPTPVSALLHAVAVVKVGVFSILRVVLYIFGKSTMQSLGLDIFTAYIASFTIICASLFALTKDNLKLRLAYSTVGQLSYIILGAALLTPSSILGGILQIAMHAFSKITLFFCAGAIYVATHKTEVSELSGIGKRMPFTMAAFAIGALSIMGSPPLCGFISKWYIALGTIEAKELLFLGVLLTSSLLSGAYLLPIVYKAFFERSDTEGISEAPIFMVIPILLTALFTILFFFFPNPFLKLI